MVIVQTVIVQTVSVQTIGAQTIEGIRLLWRVYYVYMIIYHTLTIDCSRHDDGDEKTTTLTSTIVL